MDDAVEDDEPRQYALARVLTLSDGVFAIALTLLVLSVRVGTDVTKAQLNDALRESRTELYAYGLSVIVIGMFWIGHHRAFGRIARVDRTLLWLNIIYLGVVALIPFPTDLLGRYSGETAPVALYAATIGTAALLSWLTFMYAQRSGLLDPRTPPGIAASVAARALSITVVFLASIPVAFWSPAAATYMWIAAVVLRRFSGQLTRHRRVH
jgi:uncharacterized membrane protein